MKPINIQYETILGVEMCKIPWSFGQVGYVCFVGPEMHNISLCVD
jgi:hypothetical protein